MRTTMRITHADVVIFPHSSISVSRHVANCSSLTSTVHTGRPGETYLRQPDAARLAEVRSSIWLVGLDGQAQCVRRK
jgi:hypothetical protein